MPGTDRDKVGGGAVGTGIFFKEILKMKKNVINECENAGTKIVRDVRSATVKVVAVHPMGRGYNLIRYYWSMEEAKKGVEATEKMYQGGSGYRYEYYEREGRKWSLIK